MYDVASLIATAIILPLFGFIAVVLRFYVRLYLKPSYIGIDDWLIVIALVLVYGQAANQIVAAVIGELGRDGQPTEKWRIAHQSKIDYAVLIFEKVTYSTIKLSVLFFFRRIFGKNATFRLVNNALIAVVTLWGLTFLFTDAFICGADSHLGHPCASNEWVSLWFAITDVVSDIVILALPYPMIRKLQMARREKIAITAIFLLGFISTIIAIVRLGFVSKNFAIYYHPSESKTSKNRTPPSFWTTVEVSVSVFAACLPALGPLIRKTPGPKKVGSAMRKGFFSSFSSQSSGSKGRMEKLESEEQITNSTRNHKSERTPSFEMQSWQRAKDMERVVINGGFIV